ncbi:MAG: oligosaccharide flippase family protein [Bacteroidota bacterium]
MRKTFITNLILMLGVNLLIKPFWILGIDRVVQNKLGFDVYGQYYILFNFALLLSVLLDFGIASYTTSSLARNPNLLEKQFPALLTVKIIFSGIYLLATLILAIVLNFDSSIWYLVFMLAINQILSFFHIYFRSTISGLQLFKTDSLFSVLDKFLMIVLCVVLIWGNVFELTILNFIYAQTLAYFLSALASFLFVRTKLTYIQLSFDKATLWQVYKQTAPYALLALIMTLYTRTDNILIGKLLPDGDYHDGIYALGYRLLEAANMFAALVSMLLLPIFSKMIAEKQKLMPIIELALGLMVAPGLIFGVACFSFQSEIMLLLSPNATNYAISVFGYVILCFIPLTFMYIFGTLLTANTSLKTLNILAAIAFAINFILNLILIPKYQALGAAYAAIITQGFIGLTNTIYAHKILKLPYNLMLYFKLLILLVLVILAATICKTYTIALIPSLIVLGFVGFLTIFVFKLLDIKQLNVLLKSRFN